MHLPQFFRYLKVILPFALVCGLAPAQAQTPTDAAPKIEVIISGGFTPPYTAMLPEFQRSSGIRVNTGSGASQGTGPLTIGAQLARGVLAHVVILSKEGLAELAQQGRIVFNSMVDLAQVPLGVPVRAGAAKPDISTPQAFAQTLLNAKTIVLPASTSGMFLVKVVFPALGIPTSAIHQTARGTQATANWLLARPIRRCSRRASCTASPA